MPTYQNTRTRAPALVGHALAALAQQLTQDLRTRGIDAHRMNLGTEKSGINMMLPGKYRKSRKRLIWFMLQWVTDSTISVCRAGGRARLLELADPDLLEQIAAFIHGEIGRLNQITAVPAAEL